MKITVKDYISWGLAIIGIIGSIIFSNKYMMEVNNRQNIHNNAQVVYQYINNNSLNLPLQVVEAVDVIYTASGVTVRPTDSNK